MNVIYIALYVALSIASGIESFDGPLNCTIEIGAMNFPTPEDTTASKNLIGLLEYIRKLMPVGVAEYVPPMDPYVSESLYPAVFNKHDSILKGSVKLSNLVVYGAQEFTINNIKVQPRSKRVDFDIAVHELVADLDYAADNFMYDSKFIFNVSGHTQLKLENFKVVGELSAATLVRSEDTYYTIVGLRAWNTADNVVIDMDTAFIPSEVIEEVKDVFFRSIALTAMNEMESLLAHFTQTQVVEFLKGDNAVSGTK